MPESYPVLEIRSDWNLGTEEMGTKTKFWYRNPASPDARWLFKYPQPNTGQHWAEKVASEVADLLDIPHARVELAICEGQRGSASESFAHDQDLIHGNQLLTGVVHQYDPLRKFHQSSHTITNIWSALDLIFEDPGARRQAKLRMAEYLVLDALIGNTDRHHENWGILIELQQDQWRVHVAPSFDHASSLGRELRGERQDRLLSANRVGDYVERGHGAIFWSEDDHRGPSPLQLVRLAVRAYADVFRPALRKVVQLDRSTVRDAVDRVPNDWMSPSARSFAIELMSYSISELKELAR